MASAASIFGPAAEAPAAAPPAAAAAEEPPSGAESSDDETGEDTAAEEPLSQEKESEEACEEAAEDTHVSCVLKAAAEYKKKRHLKLLSKKMLATWKEYPSEYINKATMCYKPRMSALERDVAAAAHLPIAAAVIRKLMAEREAADSKAKMERIELEAELSRKQRLLDSAAQLLVSNGLLSDSECSEGEEDQNEAPPSRRKRRPPTRADDWRRYSRHAGHGSNSRLIGQK